MFIDTGDIWRYYCLDNSLNEYVTGQVFFEGTLSNGVIEHASKHGQLPLPRRLEMAFDEAPAPLWHVVAIMMQQSTYHVVN